MVSGMLVSFLKQVPFHTPSNLCMSTENTCFHQPHIDSSLYIIDKESDRLDLVAKVDALGKKKKKDLLIHSCLRVSMAMKTMTTATVIKLWLVYTSEV